MTDRVDQFESLFKRASKTPFHYRRPSIDRAVLLTDVGAAESQSRLETLKAFLDTLGSTQWSAICDDDFEDVSTLMKLLDDHDVDLVATTRNLKQVDKNTPSSLGVYLDSLAQVSDLPVMVLPDQQYWTATDCMKNTTDVVVMTDHLLGDDRLVNHGALLTQANGHIHLCHIEDDVVYDYYMAAIERIPDIETTIARSEIKRQLLRQPLDYINSCIEVLGAAGLTIQAHAHVIMGHTLMQCKALVDECGADLLVLNTKEEDQLAMHGMAYPLAVELRNIPLLML